MADGRLLTTVEVRTLFESKLAALGGTVKEVFDDRSKLFARGILARSGEVQRRDVLLAGLAVRASATGVDVHPYTFREVCKNGAILAQSLGTTRLAFDAYDTAGEAAEALNEALEASAEPAVFDQALDSMRSARDMRADVVLNLITMLGRHPGGQTQELFRAILDRFLADRDTSRYGLFNAVTAVARETRDPEEKWRLERAGGGVLVASIRPQPTRPTRRSAEPLLVD